MSEQFNLLGLERFKIDKPIRLIELFSGYGSQALALKYLGVPFESWKTSSGKKLGMSQDSGTRSGMLWQFERILTELKTNGMALPQVLIMENVQEVMGKKNEKDFDKWLYRLEDFGYQNFAKILNAKDFSIPQSRNRCFMVSVLGEYDYVFPDGRPNKYCLRDFCDCGVDESYYLSPEQIQVFEEHKQKQKEKGNTFGWRPTKGDEMAQCIKAHGQNGADDTFLEEDIGGGTVIQSDAEEQVALIDIRGIYLRNYGHTVLDNPSQMAVTIQAHLSKGLTGFKMQSDNGVMETYLTGGVAKQ